MGDRQAGDRQETEGDGDMLEKDGIRETDRRQDSGDVRQDTGDKIQETGSGDRIQETGFRRQDSGDKI